MTRPSEPPILYSECPVCKSTDVHLAKIISYDYHFVECPRCGIWFVPSYALTQIVNPSGLNYYSAQFRKPPHQATLPESAKGGGVL